MPWKKAYVIYLVYSGALSALFGMIFTVSLVYQATTASLTPLQLVLVGTMLEAAIFVCEVPTGVVADVYSRRLSIIIGVFLMGAGFLVEGSWPLFVPILLAQILWGVGYTFTSGATQAWIADEIGEERAAGAYLKGAQVGQLCGLVGLIAGTALGTVRVNLPILAGGGLFFALGLFLILTMPENGFKPTPSTERTTWGKMWGTFRSGLGMVRRRPALSTILGVGLFFGLYSEGFDRLWTPHLIQRFAIPEGQMVLWFGAIRGVEMLLSAAANGLAERRLDITRMRVLSQAIGLISLGLVACLVLFASAQSLLLAVVGYWLIGIFRSLQYPLYMAWVNHRLEPQVRATVISMSSQVDAFGQIAGGPVVGAIAQAVSIPVGLYSSAALLSPVLLLFGRKSSQEEEVVEA